MKSILWLLRFVWRQSTLDSTCYIASNKNQQWHWNIGNCLQSNKISLPELRAYFRQRTPSYRHKSYFLCTIGTIWARLVQAVPKCRTATQWSGWRSFWRPKSISIEWNWDPVDRSWRHRWWFVDNVRILCLHTLQMLFDSHTSSWNEIEWVTTFN